MAQSYTPSNLFSKEYLNSYDIRNCGLSLISFA